MVIDKQSAWDCSDSGRSTSARFRVVCEFSCVLDDDRAASTADCFRRLHNQFRRIRCLWLRRRSPKDWYILANIWVPPKSMLKSEIFNKNYRSSSISEEWTYCLECTEIWRRNLALSSGNKGLRCSIIL